MLHLWLFCLLLLPSCQPDKTSVTTNPAIDFGQPIKVEVTGYNGNIMEPFLSRDGSILLFNNLNAAPENTNLHWATKINDSTFQYKGELTGVNTADLEGVPTLDKAGNLYFVTTRNYATTLSTLYTGAFANGAVTNVQLVTGVSRLQAGWVNFDVEVTADGQLLYFVDAQFDQAGNPSTADLVIAQKSGAGFIRSAASGTLLKNINTGALEYAACISEDQLELYFTRLQLPVTPDSSPEIFLSTRLTTNDVFGLPTKIKTITGFAEAPTISPDQRTLYYHKKENNKFVLYMIRKK